MKEVILNGFIGDKYGRHWTIQAERPHDVFSCIEANYPSFRRDMIEYVEAGGGIDVQCGDRFLEEEDLLFSIPEDSMIITPIPGGAKSGGAKLLLAALLVASFFIPGSTFLVAGAAAPAAGSAAAVAAAGGGLAVSTTAAGAIAAGGALSIPGLAVAGLAASLALAGITQMMAPDVKAEKQEERNYLFDGPQNTIAQNNVVPVLMGEMIVGGVIIASGTVSGLENRSNTFVVQYPTPTVRPDPQPTPRPGGPNDGVTDITSVPGGGGGRIDAALE